MWRNAKKFPAKTYLVLTSALLAKGYRAPITLWNMTEAS